MPHAEKRPCRPSSLFRRAGALLTALALAVLLLAGCAVPAGTDAPSSALIVPNGPPMSQRAANAPDAAAYETLLDSFAAACAQPGGSARVEQLYGQLLDGFDALATAAYLADLAYDAAPDDGAAARQAEANALYVDLSAQALGCLQQALDGPHAAQMRRLMAGADASFTEDDGAGTELLLRENELQNQYTAAMSGDFTAVVDGESWTFARLDDEGDALDNAAYDAVWLALSRLRNAAVGPLLLELAQVRRQLAEAYGYDSYTAYAYDAFFRDYTPAQAASLEEQVLALFPPLYDALEDPVRDAEAWDALSAEDDLSNEELLSRAGQAMQALDPELGRLFAYLLENELYDIDFSAPGRGGGCYTVPLPLWRDAFIFYTRTWDPLAPSGLLHEFGHFAAFCQNTQPELFALSPFDVSELQSQGLELLALSQAETLYPGAADSARYDAILTMLSLVTDSCMINAFETALYDSPPATLDEVNRLWAAQQEAYGIFYYDTVDGLCYDWVEVYHLFASPLYYFSYCTSALAALDLWTRAQTAPAEALATYKTLLASTQPYRAAVKACGLRDIFDPDQLADLTQELRRVCREQGIG